VLRLLAEPMRWRLMRELSGGDKRVRELVTAVGQPQNLVSYHLRQLRDGGLVTARRSSFDARDTYYSLNSDDCSHALTAASAALAPTPAAAPPSPPAPGSPAPGDPVSGGPAPGSPVSGGPASGGLVSGGPGTRVLFVCTGNSGRSPMAAALLRGRAGKLVQAASAGTRPKPVHPGAVAVMRDRYGIDIAGHEPVHVRNVAGDRFDYVITVCDKAREACPDFADRPARIHWSIPDPAIIESSAPESSVPESSGPQDGAITEGSVTEGGSTRYPAFERTAAELDARIRFFLPILAPATRT
jgi:protein-tyrosine-phosphatase/DNA-binding transcriptional ArsR family regulator